MYSLSEFFIICWVYMYGHPRHSPERRAASAFPCCGGGGVCSSLKHCALVPPLQRWDRVVMSLRTVSRWGSKSRSVPRTSRGAHVAVFTLLLCSSVVEHQHEQSSDGYHSEPLSGPWNDKNQPVRLLVAQLYMQPRDEVPERHQRLQQCAGDYSADSFHRELDLTLTWMICPLIIRWNLGVVATPSIRKLIRIFLRFLWVNL